VIENCDVDGVWWKVDYVSQPKIHPINMMLHGPVHGVDFETDLFFVNWFNVCLELVLFLKPVCDY